MQGRHLACTHRALWQELRSTQEREKTERMLEGEQVEGIAQ